MLFGLFRNRKLFEGRLRTGRIIDDTHVVDHQIGHRVGVETNTVEIPPHRLVAPRARAHIYVSRTVGGNRELIQPLHPRFGHVPVSAVTEHYPHGNFPIGKVVHRIGEITAEFMLGTHFCKFIVDQLFYVRVAEKIEIDVAIGRFIETKPLQTVPIVSAKLNPVESFGTYLRGIGAERRGNRVVFPHLGDDRGIFLDDPGR